MSIIIYLSFGLILSLLMYIISNGKNEYNEIYGIHVWIYIIFLWPGILMFTVYQLIKLIKEKIKNKGERKNG